LRRARHSYRVQCIRNLLGGVQLSYPVTGCRDMRRCMNSNKECVNSRYPQLLGSRHSVLLRALHSRVAQGEKSDE
jgi:hypothetical protein